MAEAIELLAEKWVNPLTELVEFQVCDLTKAKEIVKKRRDFEYKLASGAIKDRRGLFFEAIAYEINLEVWRKKRFSDLKIKKVCESSLAGIRRINALFRRVASCYGKEDVKVWFQYLEYLLRSGQTKQMKQVAFDALKNHDKNVELWLLVIKREREEGNVLVCRKLFVRALRFLSTEEDLWSE